MQLEFIIKFKILIVYIIQLISVIKLAVVNRQKLNILVPSDFCLRILSTSRPSARGSIRASSRSQVWVERLPSSSLWNGVISRLQSR